jgi:hypothetical protein
VISEILGHSSIAITGHIYGHVSPDVARQAIAMLEDAFDHQPTSWRASGGVALGHPGDLSRGQGTPRSGDRDSRS